MSGQLVPEPVGQLVGTEPVIETWAAQEPLYRCHASKFEPTAFNPGFGSSTRFAFFGDPIVPVWYGGHTEEVAIAESLFHDLASTGAEVTYEQYRQRVVSSVRPGRDLRLLSLRGPGLIALRIGPHQLTDTTPEHYARTVLWAQELHQRYDDLDGLIWMSRRWNTHAAVVLFGDRVADADLTLTQEQVRSLDDGSDGYKWLYELCDGVGVRLLPPPN